MKSLESKREETPGKELSFEEAVMELTEKAIKNDSDEPIIVALYGDANAGKTKFLRETIRKISETNKNSEHQKEAYGITGTNNDGIKRFLRFKKGNPGIKFPL